jgi:hypothetical protein
MAASLPRQRSAATGQPLSVEASLVDYLVRDMLDTSADAMLPG